VFDMLHKYRQVYHTIWSVFIGQPLRHNTHLLQLVVHVIATLQ